MPSLPPAPLVSLLDRPGESGSCRPFYGYVMLAVTTLTTAATSPGQSFVVGAFSDAIRTDLGISLSGFSAAYMIATFCASLPLTLVGRLGDRYGTRAVMAWVGLLLGAACGLVGLATGAVAGLDLGDTTGPAVLLTVLTVTFFLLRFLGQGALGLVSSHALAMWFERRLGLMESIRHLGMPLAVATLPAVLIGLIDAQGWRAAYALLGVGVWTIVLPLALLAHANRPEDLGQRLDGVAIVEDPPVAERTATELDAPSVGEAAETPSATRTSGREGAQFTLREALRTRAYWVVTASMVLSAAVGTAFVFHTQPMMRDLGLDTRAAAAVVGTLGVVSLATTVPFGYLTDRVRPRFLLAATGVLLGAACAVYGFADRMGSLLGAGRSGTLLAVHGAFLLLAVSQALLFVLASPIFARFFGRRHHGAIRGSLTTFMVIGTSVGPFLFAWWRDVTGDFAAAYLAAGALSMVLAVWSLWLTPPRRRSPAGGA